MPGPKPAVLVPPNLPMSRSHSRGLLTGPIARLRCSCTRRGRGLLAKHKDAALATRLYTGEVWVGMSVDLLRDSVGEPEAVERRVLGDRIILTWKYAPLDMVNYCLHVTIDEDRVVGLDDLR